VSPLSFVISYWSHLGSNVGASLDLGSVYSPGMITTRSLLPDAFTAVWIERKRQRLQSLRLRSNRAWPSRAVRLSGPSEGRRTYPFLSAAAIDRRASVREFGWQTTRVEVRSWKTAEASERAVGTCPPAQGFTEQSGAGSGQ
jgi:hypothetical protein